MVLSGKRPFLVDIVNNYGLLNSKFVKTNFVKVKGQGHRPLGFADFDAKYI